MYEIDEGMIRTYEQKIGYNIIELLTNQNELLERLLIHENNIGNANISKEVKNSATAIVGNDKTIEKLSRQKLITLAKEKGMTGNLISKKTEELQEFIKGVE